MLKRIAFTSLFFAYASFVAAESTPQGYAFHPLNLRQTDEGSLFLAEAKVADATTWLLIDSGCAYSVAYDEDFVRDILGKELTASGKVGGAGGPGRRSTAAIGDTAIGIIQIGAKHDAPVVPVNHLEHLRVDGKEVKIGGLVGSKLLKSVRGVFDYGAGRILIPTGEMPAGIYKLGMEQRGAVVLPLHEGKFHYPYAVLKIKGKDYAFLLDTGANGNVLEPSVVAELGLEAGGETSTVRGMLRTDGVKRVKIKDTVLAGHFKLTELSFVVIGAQSSLKVSNDLSIGGILGTPLFKQIKAQIDFDSYSLIVPKSEG